MAFSDRINESIRGRSLGFEFLSSGKHGTTKTGRMLVGPEVLRLAVTTAETTATNLSALGFSLLTTSVSSGVYTLDPPIPGCAKTIVFGTTAASASPIYLKTANGEFINSTQGTTMSVLISSQTQYATVKLAGVTTSIWAVLGGLSSASIRATTTT